MPATAEDAKGLLLENIQDDNPVVFLEHRWLHNIKVKFQRNQSTFRWGKHVLLEKVLI